MRKQGKPKSPQVIMQDTTGESDDFHGIFKKSSKEAIKPLNDQSLHLPVHQLPGQVIENIYSRTSLI